MVQRDIIKDQIEQAGKVLGKVMGKFFGLESSGNIIQGIEESRVALKEELELDLDELLELEEFELEELITSRYFDGSQMEQLADYLRTIGEHHLAENPGKATLFFQKSYYLYRLSGQYSQLFSLERAAKEQKLVNLLNQANGPT